MSVAFTAGTASSSAEAKSSSVMPYFSFRQLHHRQLHAAADSSASPIGSAAQQQVQRLSGDGLRQRLLVLLRAQVGQQVRDHQPGMVRAPADVHL